MADNTTLPGTGEVYASEEITEKNSSGVDVSVNYSKVKVSHGVDGAAVTSSNLDPMPVADHEMLDEIRRLTNEQRLTNLYLSTLINEQFGPLDLKGDY